MNKSDKYSNSLYGGGGGGLADHFSLSSGKRPFFSLTGAFQLEIRTVCQLFESEQKWSYSLPECVNLCSCSRVR